jgi:hypothetical protein
VRNAALTADKIDRDDFSYDVSPQTPAPQFLPTKQVDAVILGWMGARRLLARVIYTGTPR